MEKARAEGKIRLPALISDNMVLQEGEKVSIWGASDAGEKVTVGFLGQSVTSKADAKGGWEVEIGPFKAGGPFQMTIAAGGETKKIKNVLVGELWVASGQSNMEWSLAQSSDSEKEMAAANYPMIRYFDVGRTASETPLNDVFGQWAECSPLSAGRFSAVAYFFGRELHRELNKPVGLINASWGGSRIEPWTGKETLQALKGFEKQLKSLQETEKKQTYEEFMKELSDWEIVTHRNDPGNKGVPAGYAEIDFDDKTWDEMLLPVAWEKTGKGLESLDGAVWFRKTVDIPASWLGRDLFLSLGAIDDFDTTYFNNRQVGATGKETRNYWMALRKYSIPAPLVRQGKNVIAVRVFDHFGNGGIMPSGAYMRLYADEDLSSEFIPVDGTWKYRIELELKPINPDRPKPNFGVTNIKATMLYNAMIHPLTRFRVRGAIWYQGESNAGEARVYRTLFPAMIKNWRQAWKNSDMPFLFVQLANFQALKTYQPDSSWAPLRESQLAALELPHTGMAVAIDIGDGADIHPKNKLDVGRRLALAALANTYGRKSIVYSGPIYRAMAIKGKKVYLSFDHTGGGLIAKGGKLKGFVMAGGDKIFVPAAAEIEKDKIVVSCAGIDKPASVRYAWADNPDCNLYNREGLPASPFRTDSW